MHSILLELKVPRPCRKGKGAQDHRQKWTARGFVCVITQLTYRGMAGGALVRLSKPLSLERRYLLVLRTFTFPPSFTHILLVETSHRPSSGTRR